MGSARSGRKTLPRQSNSSTGLKIVHTNEIYIALTQPDIIAITETWTNDCISNHYLSLPNYAIISRLDRNDTLNGRGGGLLVFAKESSKAVEFTEHCSFNQFSSLRISPPGGNTLSLFVIYRSPNSNPVNNDSLLDVLCLKKEKKWKIETTTDFAYRAKC